MKYNTICKLKEKAPIAYYAIKAAISMHNRAPSFESKMWNSHYIGGVLCGLMATGIINVKEEDLLDTYFTVYLK